MKTRILRASALLAAACLLTSCANPVLEQNGTSMIGAPGMRTLVNLHPDPLRAKVYAVNYQQAGLIPVCSPVELLEITRKALRFRVEKTGREYHYLYQKAAAEPFPDHLKRFFGRDCPAAEIESLSALDRKGIEVGKPQIGMTKRGIAIAMGYPPRHITPNLESDQWLYWRSRMNRLMITFDQEGKVSDIRD